MNRSKDIDNVYGDIQRQLVEFGSTSSGTPPPVALVDASAESLLLERLKPIILSGQTFQFVGYPQEVGQEANQEALNQVHDAPIPRRRGRVSLDEELAQANGLPTSADDLVSMPIQAFHRILQDYQLNKEQKALAKKIRRRGRNKIAARKVRLRKEMEEILRSSATTGSGSSYGGSCTNQNEEDELAAKSIWSPGSC